MIDWPDEQHRPQHLVRSVDVPAGGRGRASRPRAERGWAPVIEQIEHANPPVRLTATSSAPGASSSAAAWWLDRPSASTRRAFSWCCRFRPPWPSPVEHQEARASFPPMKISSMTARAARLPALERCWSGRCHRQAGSFTSAKRRARTPPEMLFGSGEDSAAAGSLNRRCAEERERCRDKISSRANRGHPTKLPLRGGFGAPATVLLSMIAWTTRKTGGSRVSICSPDYVTGASRRSSRWAQAARCPTLAHAVDSARLGDTGCATHWRSSAWRRAPRRPSRPRDRRDPVHHSFLFGPDRLRPDRRAMPCGRSW